VGQKPNSERYEMSEWDGRKSFDFEIDALTPLSIEAVVGGKFIPATHWQPAEHPSVDSVKVFFGKIDVTSEIGAKEMHYIEQQVMEEYDKDAFETDEVRRYG